METNMPIIFKQGDLFAEKYDILVNTVNCYGAMGKGIALAFKKRYPDMYVDYVHDCDQRVYKPGTIRFYFDKRKKQAIINFATKNHWRYPSKYEWIENGLIELSSYLRSFEFANRKVSIAIPALGCSNGKLDWVKVKELIVRYLGNSEHNIVVFEPRENNG